MRIRRVRVFGFRGVASADLLVSRAAALVGPNGCGKSTIVDAVSLALGRPKMVRQLTEHDFTGSSPQPVSRLRVLVTLVGFPTEDPNDHEQWFRMGRGVEKWLDGAAVRLKKRHGCEASRARSNRAIASFATRAASTSPCAAASAMAALSTASILALDEALANRGEVARKRDQAS